MLHVYNLPVKEFDSIKDLQHLIFTGPGTGLEWEVLKSEVAEKGWKMDSNLQPILTETNYPQNITQGTNFSTNSY